MSKHRRPGDRRPGLVLASLAVAGVTLLGASSPAMAAKGGGGKPSAAPTGTCSANPDPVAVGADYTLTATGLGAGTIVNVLITDARSTTSWNLEADASGTSSVTWHSYTAGESKVVYQKSNRRGWTTVASCSFQVY